MKYLDGQPMTFASGFGPKEKLVCPKCDNSKFYFYPKTGEWMCERCGAPVKRIEKKDEEK